MKKLIMVSFVLLVATSLCVQDGMPLISQETTSHAEACTTSWICTDWSEECLNSEYTRKCEDINRCNTTDGKPSETMECEVHTDVDSLQFLLLTAKNSDPKRPGLDGFEFKLAPKDDKGSLIKQAGTIDIKLWYRVYDENNQPVKGDVIDEWTGIEVAEDDYEYTGVYVSVTFDEDFTPDPKDYAILEVTLTTPEGAKVTGIKSNFLLGRQIFY